MKGKLWYVITLLAFSLLPLAGCSGGSSSATKITEKGTEITVSGNVIAKSSGKSVFLSATSAGAVNNVFVYNAQDGAQLGVAAIAANGTFSNLTFTLPTAKAVLVFKAIVSQGTFRSVVPIDLSNPPPAGTVTGSNPISIVISQETTNIAATVSALLGLTGVLGDTGMTLASVGKTYADAAQLIVNNGGQQLAYSGSGLVLSGKFSSAALLPALDANVLDVNILNNTTLDGSITSVAIPGNKPIVSFQVINKDTGKGIRGLTTFNLVIAQLQPATANGPSQWLSYMVTGSTSRPGTDSGYTVIDNGDGSYTVLFGKDIKNGTGGTVPYNASLTHRLMVGIRTTPTKALQQNGVVLSNFYNEKYFLSDFVPATPTVTPTEQRNMTTTDSCNECHTKIGVTTPHGGRGDVKYCMMCHTSQRANGRTNSASVNGVFTGTTYVTDGEVSGEFVTMIHKIHMGSLLTKKGYNYADVLFNNVIYPKGVDNCRQCHKGDTPAQLALAPQGNNWKEKPTRKSCGSCHDNINFATGANSASGVAGHMTGDHPAQADDSFCVSCHGTSGPYPVEKHHASINATFNNPNVPDGLANFTYDVNSVTVNASNQPVIKFRIMQAVAPSTTQTPIVLNGTTTAPLTGFTGSPSFLLAYYLPTATQTDVTSADYNNAGLKAAQPNSVSIASLMPAGNVAIDGVTSGSNGLLSLPDANGYYTATLKNATASAFPVGSTMRAVGLQGYFTQVSPAAARHTLSVVKEVSGDAVRREVVDSAKCGRCHEWFEGHGGNRVVGIGTVGQSICALCHNPNLTTSGRGIQQSLLLFIANNPVGTSLAAVTNFLTGSSFSGTVSQGAKDANTALIASLGDNPTLYPEASNNFKDMIHGVHAGKNAATVGIPLAFVRDRGTSGEFDYNFEEVTFPGVLKTCLACHKDTTNSTNATYVSIPSGAQVSTQVTTTGVPLTLQTAVGVGNNVTQVSADRASLPNAQDLVTTPFTATCRSCHSQPQTIAHFKSNGGQLLVQRNAVVSGGEACATCHGTTGPNALWNVHRFSVVAD